MTTFTAERQATLRERIRARATVEDRGYRTPCWISDRAAGGKGGYTKIGVTINGEQQLWYTHRLAYVLFVGPIPEGLQIDHRCNQTKCCNPDHLEPVTVRENLLRSTNAVADQRAQDECVAGHAFDEANTYVDSLGRRHCRACKRRRHSEWRQRRKAARSARHHDHVTDDRETA